MVLRKLIQFLENKFPLGLQEDYDNSGLQLGDVNQEISGVLIALDCTEAIIDEALEKKCNVILVHHPLLFKGIKRIGTSTSTERIIRKCIQNDLNVYAIHTNLDNHIDGVNAKIAEKIGLQVREILLPKVGLLFKLSIYIPTENVELFHESMCETGVGSIGNYIDCSFQTLGIGTFTPTGSANPTIGSLGEVTKQEETRIDYLIEKNQVEKALNTMRLAHPYEEVAHDLIPLSNVHGLRGSGMIGMLDAPKPGKTLLEELKAVFNCGTIKYTAEVRENVHKIAFCGGSGSFLLERAIQMGADVFISADFKYHDYFRAEGKIQIIDIGHFESEQFTCELLAEIIQEIIPTFAVHLTENNTNPVNYI